jgi:hypothetical protein
MCVQRGRLEYLSENPAESAGWKGMCGRIVSTACVEVKTVGSCTIEPTSVLLDTYLERVLW